MFCCMQTNNKSGSFDASRPDRLNMITYRNMLSNSLFLGLYIQAFDLANTTFPLISWYFPAQPIILKIAMVIKMPVHVFFQ